MPRFRRTRTLQKFVSVYASVHNHFNQERHLYSRANFKTNRTAALSEWRQLCSAKVPAFDGKLRLVRIGLTPTSLKLLGKLMSGVVKKKLKGIIAPDKENRIAKMKALGEKFSNLGGAVAAV